MEIRDILRSLIVEAYTEGSRKLFHRPLQGKEVFCLTECRESNMRDLVREFCERKCLRIVYIRVLEESSGCVALLHILNHRIQHGRSQCCAHDGKVCGNRVQQANHIAFFRISGDMKRVKVSVRIERQCGHLKVTLRYHYLF